jgi:hypothetical protein
MRPAEAVSLSHVVFVITHVDVDGPIAILRSANANELREQPYQPANEANSPHSPQRRPQADVWRHSGRHTQAAVVARAWLGQGALRTQAGRRGGVLAALAWINRRFFRPPCTAQLVGAQRGIGGEFCDGA